MQPDYFYHAIQKSPSQLYAVYSYLDNQYIGPFIHDVDKRLFIMYNPFSAPGCLPEPSVVLDAKYVRIRILPKDDTKNEE